MHNRLKPGQPRAKEAIEMENTGVTRDVCECRHNVGSSKCDLPEITVTERCACSSQQVDIPHYCQSYEKK